MWLTDIRKQTGMSQVISTKINKRINIRRIYIKKIIRIETIILETKIKTQKIIKTKIGKKLRNQIGNNHILYKRTIFLFKSK